MDIKKYISETTEYDKKLEVEHRKVKSWLKSVSAFANESVVADATDHKRLVLNGRNSSFDARPSDEQIDDFSFSKVRSRYYAWNGVSFDNKLYRSSGMVDNKGVLTYAGLLMANECLVRQSRVFCTRWNGTTRANGSVIAICFMVVATTFIYIVHRINKFSN